MSRYIFTPQGVLNLTKMAEFSIYNFEEIQVEMDSHYREAVESACDLVDFSLFYHHIKGE